MLPEGRPFPSRLFIHEETSFLRFHRGLLLFIAAIVCVLAFLGFSFLKVFLTRGAETGSLDNERQLMLATQQMAFDGSTTTNPSIGWPGDVGNTLVQQWMANVVPTYMQTNDITKCFWIPGMTPVPYPDISGANIPYKVYAVKATNRETRFLS